MPGPVSLTLNSSFTPSSRRSRNWTLTMMSPLSVNLTALMPRLDCQMPLMDGYTATRLIRSDARFATLPIIALTANALVADRAKALDCGMNDCLVKPIRMELLHETLARWCGSGIDLDAGLAHAQGNRALYQRLLLMFRDEFQDFGARFEAARGSADLQTRRRLAHTLRAVADSLGLRGVKEVAQQLELALADAANAFGTAGDSRIDKTAQAVQRALNRCLNALTAQGLTAGPAPPPQTAAQAPSAERQA